MVRLGISLLAMLSLLFAFNGASAQTATYVNSWFTNAQGAQVRCVGLPTPAETVPGDLMLALFTVADGTPTKTGLTSIEVPAGWTLVRGPDGTVADENSVNATGFGIRQVVYYHIASDNEPPVTINGNCKDLPGNYIWNFSNDNSQNKNGIRITAGIVVYHGVDSANPIESVSSTASVSTTSIVAPSVTTATANTTLIGIFGSATNVGNQGLTQPATMTIPPGVDDGNNGAVDPYNQQSGAGPNGVSQMIATEQITTPGVTGNRVATGDLVQQGVVGQLLAIRGSPLDHFTIEAADGMPISQQTAGQSFAIRVMAVDANGDQVAYFGTVDIQSDCTMSSGSGTTGNFVDGRLDNYAVTIIDKGTCHITATETGGSTTGVSNDFEMAPGPFLKLQISMPAAVDAGAPFAVTVNAVDADGNIVTTMDDEVSLTSGDALAVMPPGLNLSSGTASFTVTLNTGGLQTITATDTVDPAVTAAQGATTVAPLASGFNAFDTNTPAGNTVGWITTKIAGQPFTLDILAITNGNYQKQVTVELIAANNATGGCPDSLIPIGAVDGNGWTGLARWTVDFKASDANRMTMPPFAETNAWRYARILIIDSGNKTYCSNDLFAIRPDALGAVTVQDATRTMPGRVNTLNVTSVGNTHVHNAGRPFRVAATGLNLNGNVTTNYNGSPQADILGLILPNAAECSTCSPGTFSTGTWSTSGGTVVTTTATYSEAGAFTAQLVDRHFADIDARDGSTEAQRYVYSSTFDVGRFVPDHFAVARNSPAFATACAAGRFTYTGEPFSFATAPVINVTAQNAQGEVTRNYAASLWRLTNASITGRSYQDAAAPATLDTAGLPKPAADPAIAAGGDGTGTLTFSTGAGLDYVHGAPVAPFNSAIALSINVEDADGVTVAAIDGVAAANPVTFAGIPFDNGNQLRYGRVFVNTAVGSELLALPVAMLAQYYAGADTGFTTNADDACTNSASVALTNFQPYPNSTFASGDTSASLNQLAGSTTPGDFGLSFSAPGSGHQGTADVGANVPLWLRYDWDGDGAYDDEPASRISFGLYKGNAHQIYRREVIGP